MFRKFNSKYILYRKHQNCTPEISAARYKLSTLVDINIYSSQPSGARAGGGGATDKEQPGSRVTLMQASLLENILV